MSPAEPSHHLAQLNIGRLRAPRETPDMAGYRAALAEVLPIGLAWPGFVWMHDDGIIEGARRKFGPDIAANLSLWRDLESLRDFMDCPPHAAVMARRAEWFRPMDEATFVLWWVPVGHRPDLAEAHGRLERLRRTGPTAAAFDLDRVFPPPA
jgi:hypothetical protein